MSDALSPPTSGDKTPDWFVRALEAPCRDRTLVVDGCSVHSLAWGDPAKPGLLLIHGGAAHAHWWGFLAPLLTHHYFVVAVDLSGHGDSGHRDQYSMEIWAQELIAIIDDCDFVSPPVLIGHSMGGLVSIATASLFGDRLKAPSSSIRR